MNPGHEHTGATPSVDIRSAGVPSGSVPSADAQPGDAQAHWDRRYREKDSIWSGEVNATLAAVLEEIGAVGQEGTGPGEATGAGRPRSLDLGCGEGGDVLWLAQRGYDAMGVDVSAVAVDRARARAEAEGLAATFEAADLEKWVPARGDTAGFDLITASFFQSTIALDRAAILASVTRLLAPGGALVIVSHATPPPCASRHLDAAELERHLAMMPSLEGELAIFADVDAVETVIGEVREREAVSPEGEAEMLEDLVVVQRRVR